MAPVGALSGSTAVSEREESVKGLELRASTAEKQLHAVTQELQREKQRNKVLQHQQQSQANAPQQGHSRPDSEDQSSARSSDLGSRGNSRRGSDANRFVEKAQELGPLEPQEQEEINWAVREYLAEAGYKLTAITFCDEVRDSDSVTAPQCWCDTTVICGSLDGCQVSVNAP